MTRIAADEAWGELVLVDRPLRAGWAWAIMVVPVLVAALALLAVNPSAWPLPLGLFVALGVVSALLFGDRLLLEQRLYERALVSRTRLWLRPGFVLPLALVEPEAVRASGRVDWEAADERVYPASAILRSLPWGPTVRVPGPDPHLARVRGQGEAAIPIPRHSATAWVAESLGDTQLWGFSFGSPQDAAARIAELAAAERARLQLR